MLLCLDSWIATRHPNIEAIWNAEPSCFNSNVLFTNALLHSRIAHCMIHALKVLCKDQNSSINLTIRVLNCAMATLNSKIQIKFWTLGSIIKQLCLKSYIALCNQFWTIALHLWSQINIRKLRLSPALNLTTALRNKGLNKTEQH